MKRISALLLTFTIGVSVFNLLQINPAADSLHYCPVEKVPETTKNPVVLISYENVVTKKDKIRQPFFDSFDLNKDEQFYHGWFMPDDFKGMPEVWTISLYKDEDSEDGKPVWSAGVLTTNADGESNDDDNFQSVQIKTEGSHLSFRTNKIRGIEYKFNGDFTKNGTDFSEDENVLRGTMQKIVRGRQVAKFTAKFAYHEPHCFH